MQRLAPPLAPIASDRMIASLHAQGVDALNPGYRAARWLSPAEWMNPEDLKRAAPAWTAPRGTSRRSALVLAACRPDQVAYDAYLGGRYRGAFTAAALTALDALPLDGNYREWLVGSDRLDEQHYVPIRSTIRPDGTTRQGLLPSVDFDQIPQLDGTAAQRRWLLWQEKGRR